MDKLTQNLSFYVQNKGITVQHLSNQTGIPYAVLYKSLRPHNGKYRSLRADEFMKLCEILEIDPFDVKHYH